MMEQSLESLPTPCYLFDKGDFLHNFQGLQKALNDKFDVSHVAYSVKTNSLPYCLKIINEQGGYAEVVSEDEYYLALSIGFPHVRIIYNGPMKSEKTFIDALVHGAVVNIETKRELDWLYHLPTGQNYNVGLRLNINISDISIEDESNSNDNSRFGFSDETDEFQNAILEIEKHPNVHLSGLHVHRTSKTRSLNFYNNLLNYACHVIERYQLSIDYLDIGGGIWGYFTGKPSFVEYSQLFYSVLSSFGLGKVMVFVEPGSALVASSFDFLTSVIDVKHVESNTWMITTDGSRNDIDPFYRKTSYFYELETSNGQVVPRQIISGCTCLENDRIMEIKNSSLLSIGDKIRYERVGAYTMCLTPLFIRFFPDIYVKEDHDYRLIRQKWDYEDCLNKSILD